MNSQGVPPSTISLFRALSLGALFATMQSGCFYGVFNNTNVAESSRDLTTTEQGTQDCTPTADQPDPCFGNDPETKGIYRLGLETDTFQAMQTDMTLANGQAHTIPVTTTDSEGNFYAVYPVLNNNLSAARLVQIKKYQSGQGTENSGFSYPLITNTGGPGASNHLTVSAVKVVDGPSTQLRHIYLGGTSYNPITLQHFFAVCRMVEDFSTTPSTVGMDETFFAGGSCAVLSSSSMNNYGIGAADYSPRPAYLSPVHLALHTGSDGHQRVVMLGTAVKQSDSRHYVIIAPIRTDGSEISGTPGTGLNSIFSAPFDTSGKSSTFNLVGSARAIRVSAVETDSTDSAASNIYMLLAVTNNEVGYTVGDSTAPVEHLILRLGSNLGPDSAFAVNLSGVGALYIPATLDGSAPFSASSSPGVRALNTRMWSTAQNSADLKVHDSKIYVLGLHQDISHAEPQSLGYRLLRFSTAASSHIPDAESFTSMNTLCGPQASPRLSVQQNSGDLLIACSQKGPSNSILRAHSGQTLTVQQQMGGLGTNYASITENTHNDLQGKFTTGVISHWDATNSMHAVYLYYLEKIGTSYYPVIQKRWYQ